MAKYFNAYTDFVPRKYQSVALNAFEVDKLSLALVWCRQAGKDLLAWLLLIRHAIKVEGCHLYFFPMTKQAKRAIWHKTVPDMGRVIHWIPRKKTGSPSKADGLGYGVFSIDNTSMVIQIECVGSKPNAIKQSTIEVIGASERNADEFAGVSPVMCVFSEVGLNNTFPAIYRVLQPSMLMNNTREVLVSTPRGENHWWSFYLQAKKDPAWFTSVVQTLYPDDVDTYYPLMPVESVLSSARKVGMSDSWVAQEHGCSFTVKVEGSFYGHVLSYAREDRRIGLFPYNRRLPVDVFYDIGVRDLMALWFRQIDGERIIFIDYFEGANLGTDELSQLLLEFGYKYGVHQLPWDGKHRVHGKKVTTFHKLLKDSFKDYRVTGKVVEPVRRSTLATGIEEVRKRFSRYHFDEVKCAIGLVHITRYSSQKNMKGVVTSIHKHDEHSHCCDSLRVEACAGVVSDEPKLQLKYSAF